MSRKLPSTLAAVLAAALAAPVAAQADLLTYVDGHNVWVASPDGAVKRALTTDGHANDAFAFPSADDAGNVVAIKGYSTTKAIVVLRRDGSRTVNVMPWKTSTYGNVGPLFARVKPTTGSQLAYTYYRNHGPYSGYPNGGLEKRFAIVPPAAPGDPGNPVIDQPGKDNLTWHGDRLVGSDGTQIVYEKEPLQFVSWLSASDGQLVGAEVSRAGDRVLVAYADGRLGLLAYQGGIPDGGTVTNGCFVAAGTAPQGGRDWALSPDGRRVAWTDTGGLHVARIDHAQPGPGNGPCVLDAHSVVSGGGKDPAFSAAAAPTLPGNGTSTPGQGATTPTQGTTTPTQGTTTPAQGTTTPTQGTTGGPTVVRALRVAVPRVVARAALRRGLRTTVTAPGRGTVRATLAGAGLRATAVAAARRRGALRLTLRLPAAAKRRVARLRRGARLTLRVAFTPKGRGVRAAATRTLVLR